MGSLETLCRDEFDSFSEDEFQPETKAPIKIDSDEDDFLMTSEKAKLSNREKKPCKFCPKIISKSHISRHQKFCSKNPHAVNRKTLRCPKCKKTFSRPDSLRAHSKICNSSKNATIPCFYPDCGLKFRTKISLIQHIEGAHEEFRIQDRKTLFFENMDLFNQWKNEEECRTYSSYTQHCGERKGSKYFNCKRDGSEKAHRKKGEEARKTDRRCRRGRLKAGNHCISFMRVTTLECGAISVIYYPTHSHELRCEDIEHHRLSKDSHNYIDRQIAINQSPFDIQRKLRIKASVLEIEVGKEHKDSYITTKLIRERIRKAKNSWMYCRKDANPEMILDEVLLKEGPDQVLVYKPVGIPCKVGPKEIDSLSNSLELFMYGIQTKEQRELLCDDCGVILELDEIHDFRFDFQLLNMLIVDDNRCGWAVGHCLTNRSDEATLKCFFLAVKTKCPNVKVHCIITKDDPKLINAIEAGFEEQFRHLLCKWHLSRTFKNKLREKAPKNLVDEMFVALKHIIDVKTCANFYKYYNAYISTYQDVAIDFLNYLSKYYMTESHIPKWTSCFRNFPHLCVDTTGHIESFHRRLKADYLDRIPDYRVDNLIEILFTMAEDDLWKRKEINLFGFHQSPSDMKCKHKSGLNIPDSSVFSLVENIWEIKSALITNEFYEVSKWNDVCNDDNYCVCKCTDIECQGLCAHLYHCSCADSAPICKHIHKLHAFLNRNVILQDIFIQKPIFLECVSPLSSETDPLETKDNINREICQKRLIENLRTLLQHAETGEWQTHVLSKTDADVEAILKNKVNCDVSDVPTQLLSHLSPFKRQQKKIESTDVGSAGGKKGVMEKLFTQSSPNQDPLYIDLEDVELVVEIYSSPPTSPNVECVDNVLEDDELSQ